MSERPPLDLLKLLLRIAPKAKMNDVADALEEQGYYMRFNLVPSELAAPRASLPGTEDPDAE